MGGGIETQQTVSNQLARGHSTLPSPLVRYFQGYEAGQCAQLLILVVLECHVMLSAYFLIMQNKHDNIIQSICHCFSIVETTNMDQQNTSIFVHSHVDT